MNFLKLCQTLRRRAGIAGHGPVSVKDQQGEYERVVDWVRQAWLDLQGFRYDWRPLWRHESESMDPEQASIPLPSDWSQPILESFNFNGHYLRYVDWRHFPSDTDTTGQPTAVSRRPDGALGVWPKPETGGTLAYEYFAIPQILENNDDEPWLPVHLQDAIVFQALAYYAIYEDAPEVYNDAMSKVEDLRRRMVNEMVAGVQMERQLFNGRDQQRMARQQPQQQQQQG